MAEEKEEKTKEVFNKIGWGCIAAGTIAVIITGSTVADVNNATVLIEAAVVAVGAAIKFIFGKK